MPKPITPIALTLALAVVTGAHAATAASMGDIYAEAIWDIDATATGHTANTSNQGSPDLYREAAWSADGDVDAANRSARRVAEALKASKQEAAVIRPETAE